MVPAGFKTAIPAS